MHLALSLDSFYLLVSLWGELPGTQVCGAIWQPLPQVLRTAAEVTAFVDVNVVPMDTERVLAQQTVVVQNGRITALGPTGQVAVPAGAVRIDGRGKYLLPGLGAMHEHATRFGETEVIFERGRAVRASPQLRHALAYSLAEGVTALGSHADVPPDRLPEVRRLLATFPSPRVYFGRALARALPDDSATVAAATKAAGYDHLTTDAFPGMFSGGGEGAAGELAIFESHLAVGRQAGLPMTVHAHTIPFDAVLAVGSTRGSVDHLYAVYSGTHGSPQWQGATKDSLFAAVQRAGVWITPTLRCIAAKGGWGSSQRNTQRLSQYTKALHDIGVKLLVSRDDRWIVHDELDAFVQAGLTPYQALLTGTRHVAEYFGRLDELGTVAVGKRADLVLLAGNPLEEVQYAREPVGIMVDGRWLDQAALDQGQLGLPKEWLHWALRPTGLGNRARDSLGGEPGTGHRASLRALLDSLELAKSNKAEYERLAQRFASELGALRALLPPEKQRNQLDPPARAWMREQARQGYAIAVPDVLPTP